MSEAHIHWIGIAPDLRRALRFASSILLAALLLGAWLLAKAVGFLLSALPVNLTEHVALPNRRALALALLSVLVALAHAVLGMRRLLRRVLTMRLGTDGKQVCIHDVGVSCAPAAQVLRDHRKGIRVNGRRTGVSHTYPQAELEHYILPLIANARVIDRTVSLRLLLAALGRELRAHWAQVALVLMESLIATLQYAQRLAPAKALAAEVKR